MLIGITMADRRVSAVLTGLAVTVAACTSPVPQGNPSSPPPTTHHVAPTPADRQLRDVSRARLYRDGIARVFPETAAQMICGAVSASEWADMLGAPVGRVVYGGVEAVCVVDTGSVSVQLAMTQADLGPHGDRVDGRLAKIDAAPRGATVASGLVAVVPVGEQNIQAQQRIDARPVLDVLAKVSDITQPTPDVASLVRDVITKLPPRLVPGDRPATPVVGATGDLAYTPTAPVAGLPIFDLPRSVQSLVLCTAVLRELGITPQQAAGLLVNSVSECYLNTRRVFAKVDPFSDPVIESTPDRIAGRPAEDRGEQGVAIRLLSTPSKYGRTGNLTLRISTDGPPAQRREWAEKIAVAVLAG